MTRPPKVLRGPGPAPGRCHWAGQRVSRRCHPRLERVSGRNQRPRNGAGAGRRAGAAETGQRGAVALELVVLAPLLLAFLLLTVGLGRIELADGQVQGAARDAARAASLARTPTAARITALQTAAADLRGAGLSCRQMAVQLDDSAFHAGGLVRVAVRCTADLSAVTLSGLPGRRTLQGLSAAPLEKYRGIGG